MLVKAASHLRPILRLQNLLTNSATSTTTATTTTSSTSSTVSQAFTSNATLLTQAQVQAGNAQIATIQQGSGNFVGAAWGLGGAGAGSGPGTGGYGGQGAGSKFSGYTGFGRTLTQAPQQQSQTQDDELDESLTLADIRNGRPSTLARSASASAASNSKKLRKRSSSRAKNSKTGVEVADLDLPPSPTAVSQKIEIPLEVENDNAAATIAGRKTDLLRDVEVESAVEDPDSDIESRQAQRHRLHRRPSGRGKEESIPLVGGTWTVGLRGGKFVRLPNPSRLSSRTRTYSSQAGLSEGSGERRSTTVDDLEMNGARRAGIQRMRNLGQGKGVNGVDRVRRNSYSAPSRSRESNSSAVRSSNGNASNKPVSKGELGLAESELREELESRDWKKSRRMIQALESGQVETALRLVDEYRNPAALSSDPKISSAPHVEPPYFSQSGYNTVLQILHAFRKVGEPITQVLKAYNEMLERDVLPNIKSYSLVIRSLLERNNEVQVAVRESEAKRKWINWDRKYSRVARKDGTGGGDYSFADRDRALQPVEQQITALKKERNYENAVKLFQSGATYNRHRPFQLAVYSLLMGAAASRGDLETALLAWGHLEGVRNSANKVQETDGHTLVIMYAHLIECYSKTSEGGVEGMQDGLKRFLLDEKNGKINDGRSLDGIIKGTSEDHNLVLRAVCAVFDKLLGGYTVLGEDEKVKSLLELMRKTTKEEERRAGHLIQVNVSSISHIADALYDRGEWQKAIELVQEQRKSDLGVNLLQRTMRQLGYKALHEENIEAILAISSLMRSVTFSLETPFIRRAVVQLVMLLQQTDLEPELAAKYIGAVDFLSSSWPSTERWNIDSYTVANYVEAAIRHDHPEQAYNMLRQVSKLAAFKSLVITFDITNVMADMEKRVETIRQKLDHMHVMDFTGQGDREAYAKGLVADLLTELPTEAEAMQAWAQESDKGTLAIITRVLTRVGSELNHPLPGDRGVEFDQQSEDLIRRISAVTGEKALSRSDKAMIASLLQHRRGIADARGLLESLYGAETTAGLLGSADSASDISAALSDVTMPLSPGQTSQVSTAPTEHSEDVGAGPVRQYRAAPFSASKQIEQHLGMRPVRTPLESYSLLKGLEEQGELPHPAVIARLSTSMARLGLADKVAELYQYAHAALTHQPDDKRLDAWFTVEDQMLMACCLLGRLEQAGAHRAAILEQNRVPSAESYALMISSAKDTTDDASVARELWEESQNLGVKPTLFLYNTVISKLSRARKAESALDFFKQMKAQGIRPSSVTYGAVINACCRVGDAESAATLFEEMQAIPNHKPRVPPYNTMMQLHLQSHPSRELVLHYYNQMVQANVAPSAHTYKLLLDAYGTLEPVDLGAMQTVFNNLCKDTSVSVTGTHWASMIHATGNVAGNAQEAIDMFESISTHPSNKKGGPIEPVCWEALMSVLAQHKMVAEMESYRAKMKEQGIKSTAYVYNMLIKGFANNGQIEDARAVFESMGDGEMGKAAPNNHPTLLTSSGQVKPATTADTTVVFREPSTYETMIRAELQAGDKDAARAICDRMEARMYPIAVTTRIRSLVDDTTPAGQV